MADTNLKRVWRALRLGGLALIAGLALSVTAPTLAHAQDTAATSTAPATTEAAPVAEAAPTPTLDSGATSWMLTSSALVLLMTIPGLALFYGGMVRKKNVVATVTQSFAITCLVTVLWMVAGYSIAFGTNPDAEMNKYFGGFGAAMMNGIHADTIKGVIPEYVFMFFQMTFAIITPALICGAYAERMKFSAMMIFTAAWLLLVYAPIAHWVWGGGFLGGAGVLDFAGGTVVHINAGVAGLVCALVMGKRSEGPTPPHNVVLTMIGASLLWVGWFGFNAGSELAADGIAGAAALNTQVATAMAALAWMVIELIHHRRATLLGLCSGAVAGLVAITPASGFVNPTGALEVGAAGGAAAYFGAVYLKNLFKYDDSLDAFGVHGVAGTVGALLTGVLADPAINSLGKDHNFMTQLYGVSVTFGYTAIATFAILMVLKFTIGLTATKEQQSEGLDLVLHGEVVQ